MRFLARLIVCHFLLAVANSCAGSSPAAHAQETPQTSPPPLATLADKPLSERVVAYQIDARFDANKHTLDATEVLTYRNLTGQPPVPPHCAFYDEWDRSARCYYFVNEDVAPDPVLPSFHLNPPGR